MWVYRMLYYLYLGDRMDWYAHASVIWMKEKYTGISDYTLLDFLLMGKSPFLGMEAGKKQYKGEEERHSVLGGRITKQVQEHSIGMTPFLQYLDQRYPNDQGAVY